MGHFGSTHIVKSLISDGFYWPSMRKEAQDLVKACIQCQRYNIGRHGFHPLNPITAALPLDHLSIHLKEMPVSFSGYKYLLTMVDVFTRFVFLTPIKNKTAKTVVNALYDIFTLVGFPKIIQSDNGKEFVNKLNQKFSKLTGIEHRMITAYNSHANGLSEKMNHVAANVIYKLVQGQIHQWDKFCKTAQFFINCKNASTTGSTPYSLLFARSPNFFSGPIISDPLSEHQILERLKYLTSVVYPAIHDQIDSVNKSRAKLFEKHHNIINNDSFKPGSMVMIMDELRQSKSAPKYTGPFKVVRRNKGGAYILLGPDGTEYKRPPQFLKQVSPTMPFNPSSVVKTIVSQRKVNRQMYYLVQWEDGETEWIHENHFNDVIPITAYWKKRNVKKDALLKTPLDVSASKSKLKLKLKFKDPST